MRRLLSCTILALATVGCSHQRAGAPPPAAAPPRVEAAPPPPPTTSPPVTTPECLTLGEQCPVEADKALGVGAAMVQLPVGWTYARSTDRLTAVSADAGATIAFAAAANGTREAIRSALYALLAEHAITGVVDDAVSLEKPQVTWPAGDLSVQAWQVEKPKRGQSVQKEDPLLRGQPGALLVGVTRISEDQVVVGIGFLLRSAPTTFAQPIKDCLTSLRTEVAPAGAVGK